MLNIFHKLGFEYQPIVEKLMQEHIRPLPDLRAEIQAYVTELQKEEAVQEFLDLATAKSIADECLELIGVVSKYYSKDRHMALQVAIRYFILDDDVENDATSIIGFDDDAEVAQVAKEYIQKSINT